MSAIQETISREAKPIEDLRLSLMQSAQAMGSPTLPGYQVAGMTRDQVEALTAGRAGIGAFSPYLQTGAANVRSGATTLGEAANVLRGADTRGQFSAAQQAYNLAAQPAAALGNLSNVAGAGLGFLSGAGADIDAAQRMALESSRADLGGAQNLLTQSAIDAQRAGPQFGQAQGMIGAGAQAAMQAAQQPGFQQGIGTLMQGAQQGQQALGQAGALTQQGIGAMYQAAQQAQRATQLGAAPTVSAQQVGTPQMQAAQMGPAQQITTQSFAAPGSSQAYMSPYMQDVVAAQQREAMRTSDIQRTQNQAAATRAGAFGGSRQAIVEAERQRNLGTQLGDIQSAGLQQAYQQAQNQFNVEQQARLAAQQANQQAGITVGGQNLSAQQQANVQNQAAAMQAQGMNAQQAMQAALANQQMQGQYGLQGAQLGLQAADVLRQAGVGSLNAGQQLGSLGLQGAGVTQAAGQGQLAAAGQQGQLGLSAAGQMGQAGQQLGTMEAQRAQQALAAAQYGGTVGQQLAQQQLQQAQLGQAAAGMYGQLGTQQAGLAGQFANVAGQQANILGQQSQLQQSLGQGIGNLAAQQFGIGQNMAQGLGSLGTQLGNMGVQQAGLGQQAQAMGQQDVNFQYNLGAQSQRQSQAELDALRTTQMQQALQPQQRLAFISDIYRGAPSTQMAITQQQQAAPSPFQQIAGLGIAGVSAAAAGARAGIL